LWAGLALVCLPAIAFTVPSAAADEQAAAPKPANKVDELGPGSWRVRGWVSTRDDATQTAEKNAQKQVALYLQTQPQPLNWEPSIAYLRDNQIIRKGKEVREVDLGPGIGTTYEASLEVQVAPYQYQAMARLDHQQRKEALERERRQRARERQLPLGTAVGVLVGILAGAAIFFRVLKARKVSGAVCAKCAAVGLVGIGGALALLFIRWLRI